MPQSKPTHAMYAQREVVHDQQALFVVERGLAARAGKLIMQGGSWGDDFIVSLLPRDATATLLLALRARLALRHARAAGGGGTFVPPGCVATAYGNIGDDVLNEEVGGADEPDPEDPAAEEEEAINSLFARLGVGRGRLLDRKVRSAFRASSWGRRAPSQGSH